MLGTISAFAYRQRETKKNPHRDGKIYLCICWIINCFNLKYYIVNIWWVAKMKDKFSVLFCASLSFFFFWTTVFFRNYTNSYLDILNRSDKWRCLYVLKHTKYCIEIHVIAKMVAMYWTFTMLQLISQHFQKFFCCHWNDLLGVTV